MSAAIGAVRLELPIGFTIYDQSAAPPAKEIAKVAARASQYGTPRLTSVKAMKVQSVASSPCAKLRWPVAR